MPDVLNWEGHIACDADSRSEIVVPILVNGEVSIRLYLLCILSINTVHRLLQSSI